MSTGLKDGFLTVHDMRTHQIVARNKVHQAAINFLDSSLSGFVVTGSADKTIKTFDIFNGFKPLSVMNATDAVFCGEVL
jgi:WD40 repeat protein